ncbi:MAG: aminotransferase class I/II-fold pyridoxal phosphate-dependent enzyme [Gemmataceae bacterium]
MRAAGLHRTRRRLLSGQGAEVRWRHADFINFSSNDYLGYATDPRLSRAAARAAARYGAGAGASPLVSGYTPPLRRLERDLAAWEGAEAALVFASGYAANLGAVGTLGRGGVVFSDELNHASVIDGCRLARADVHVYRHGDLKHLAELLKAHPGPRRLIVSDSVFSMDGDRADVAGLAALAEEHDALLVLDEAHATGVLGEHGRGLTDGLTGGRVVKVGTLSKALASQGGFVCATARVIEYLVNAARPYVFSTALAPAAAAAARRAVFLVGQEPHRRAHVLALAESLRGQLRAAGFDVGRSACHIVPVIVGAADDAVALAERLAGRRLLVPAIRPPSVPAGTSRLRISLSAAHTEEDVARLVAGMRGG